MGGIFSSPKPPAPDPSIKEAQDRAEARATAQEQQERARMAGSQRARRTGGIRMLMSPYRQEGPQAKKTKLGGGS